MSRKQCRLGIPAKEGNEINLLDVIEGKQPDVVEKVTLAENLQKMYQFMDACLNERERDIIYMRYGLYQGKEMTQSEIGKKLGISRSYVSRIEKKALLKLKEEFEKQNIV